MIKKLILLCAMLHIGSIQAEVTLSKIGTYTTNLGEGSAEISSYDAASQRLFVINSTFGSFSIIDFSNPALPSLISNIDITAIGPGVTSIAVFDGLVAVAIPAINVTDDGKVAFFDINGGLLNQVTVGALPDMLTFNHLGNKVLVANEGEPDNGINPDGSVSVIELTNGVNNATVNNIFFTDFNSDQSRADELPANVIVFPGNSVSQDLEPEYISILSNDSKAFVTLQENNAVAVINLENQTIDAIHGLGFKDHSLNGNELDPSNQDSMQGEGSIQIANWPIFGMYQPDSIATYSANNNNYYLTANEGDARDEDQRIKDLILDTSAFPNAVELQSNAQLGRLNVSSVLGDEDNDMDFDKLYAYGARSFSIWIAQTGAQVFDSGNQFEKQISIQAPEIFNSNGGTIDSFDSRSDDKGPEPEGIIVAEIESQHYAFIGLERVGGIMVYNITDPANAVFERYQPSTDGDQAPEGLLFIKSSENSTGKNLLLVSHEDSGTVAIYAVNSTIFKNGFEL